VRTLTAALAIAGVAIIVITAQADDDGAGESTVVNHVAGRQLLHPDPPPAPSEEGLALYDRFCLACHGTFGDGQGPGAPWLWPRPRDFTSGNYKWRTTTLNSPPTDDDLRRAIMWGVPGTSMHPFGQSLTAAEIDALLLVLKSFAPERFHTDGANPVTVGAEPTVDDAMIDRGKTLYASLGCTGCHGDTGKGDGAAARSLIDADGNPGAPYDITSEPLRRPHKAGGELTAIYTSIASGLAGTAMVGFAGAVPDDDLWALSAYVDSIRFIGKYTRNPTLTHDIAKKLDAKSKRTNGGYWPGHGTEEESAVWGKTIEFQGPAPDNLAPAQASSSVEQCTRCHAKQRREWKGSLHALAGSPGLLAQVARLGKRPASAESCQRCHAPLPEQLPRIRAGHRGGDDTDRTYEDNPDFDDDLRKEGINCASCHVRKHIRNGPEMLDDSKLLDLPGYQVNELAIYERSDFCVGCHQLPARIALNGKPLLNTYREWLEGPYMRRGIQCQHCHMPNREHTFKGVHDKDTFRQGIKVETITGKSGSSGAVSVRTRVWNVGAGHYLPTTPTPAAFVSIELVDGDGDGIKGAFEEKRIGRHIVFGKGGFSDLEDTRIPPGENLELAMAWKDGRVSAATHARIIVRVEPDNYYVGLYKKRLKLKLDDDVRDMFEEALDNAEKSDYVAYEKLIPLDDI
jgi:mono/diheme cytochrome c family protein